MGDSQTSTTALLREVQENFDSLRVMFLQRGGELLLSRIMSKIMKSQKPRTDYILEETNDGVSYSEVRAYVKVSRRGVL